MPPTLLTTKLYRPRATSTLVARPRLTERLAEGQRSGHPLLLVVAPPGYGKTTLVSDWLGESRLPSAWLLLDEGDNDPTRFFHYVVAALQALDPNLGASLLESLERPSGSPSEWVLPLINDLARAASPLLLVLDDYHLITCTPIQEAMAYLIDHAPPQFHLVLITRVDPPFPLPRLRVRQRMTEIRDQDLRFASDEMTHFLNAIHQLNLDSGQVAALESRTEGWVAGVQLAALSLQGHSAEQAARFIESFSGSHHYVIDYLGDEVLRRLPEDIQSFLLQTSLLQRFTASLCDAVVDGPPGGEAMLLELERRNLFLIPLDDERLWYRYHHLFSDLLFQRQRATHPDRLRELYHRAALWMEQNNYPEDAVDYALKAQDYEYASRLIHQIKYVVGHRGQMPTLLSWFNALPDEAVRAQPDSCFGKASALTMLGYFDAAEPWLQRAEDGFRPLAPSDRFAANRLAKMPVYRSIYARFRGDLPAALALGQAGLDHTPRSERRDWGIALLFAGHAHYYAGHTAEAERILLEAIETNQATQHYSALVNASHHLAQLRVLQGRLREAADIYTFARVNMEGTGLLAGAEYFGLGDLKREWGRLEEARSDIETGLQLAEASDHIFFLTAGYLARVRLALAQHDPDSANRYLDKADQAVHRSSTSTEIDLLREWRVRVWLSSGGLVRARQWAETVPVPDAETLIPQQEGQLLTLARVWLALGKPARAAALLTHVAAGAETAGRHGRVLEANLLLTLCQHALGQTTLAVQGLGRALSRAEPEGYQRLFVDLGRPMAELLQLTIARGLSPLYSSRLLAAIEADLRPGSARPASGAASPLVEPLTEREMEVLHLVSAGLSNGEIASRLVLSLTTVKKHVQNIHGKLDVKNRTAAVARARELHLL